MKRITSFVCAFLVAAALVSVSNTVFAGTGSSELDQVTTISELQNALTEGATIYISSGTYEIPDNFTIPADVTLIGETDSAGNNLVTFDTGESLTSSQSGLYIYNDGIILQNINITNSTDADKPPVKIEADNVALVNCVITANERGSALVVHGSTGVSLTNCSIEKTNGTTILSGDYYAVIQVNSGSSVTISGGTITAANYGQAHVTFEYSSSSTLYDAASKLYLSGNITFTGGYGSYPVIYSAAPSSLSRDDQLYVNGTLVVKQTSSEKTALETTIDESTIWYSFNADAWDTLLVSYDGYLYSTTNDTSLFNTIKLLLSAS